MRKRYTKIRLVIADDHELVREGLQVMIKKIDDLEIIGEACNGEELIQITRKLLPDVVLTDVKMPVLNGAQATKIIKQEFPNIGVLALSSFDEENLIIDMIQAGAKGYLLKNAGKDEITAAVKAAYKNEPYYCNHTNTKLAQMIAKGGFYTRSKTIQENFTEREHEVIQMICDGLSSKQIGVNLNIQTRTVERYRDSIMHKMDVNNSAGVVMYAISHGLCKIIERK